MCHSKNLRYRSLEGRETFNSRVGNLTINSFAELAPIVVGTSLVCVA